MKELNIVIIGDIDDVYAVFETIQHLASIGKPIKVVGFLNDDVPVGFSVMGIPVLGELDLWNKLPLDICFIPVFHNVKQTSVWVEKLVSLGIPQERWTTIIHPTALIADDVTLSYGSFVGPYVVIQPEVHLGAFLSIRDGVAISHDCRLNDFVYLGSKSCLSGRCTIDIGVYVSSNVAVANNVRIGAYSVIALNTAVRKNVPEYSFVEGNPGRIIYSL